MANNQIALLARAPEIDSPYQTEAKALQLSSLRNAGAVQDLEMQQRRQAMEDDAVARQAFAANPNDPAARLKALAPSPKAYAAERKAQGDYAKDSAEADAKKTETAVKKLTAAGQSLGYVMKNPTLPAALSVLDQLERDGIYSSEDAAKYRKIVQDDPSQIPGLAQQAFTAATSAKDQLAKLDTRNLGGKLQNTSTDPITGKVTVTDTNVLTQSPDNRATNDRVASEGRLNRAQSQQQFNTREQRESETGGRSVIIQTDEGPMLANPRTGNTKPIIGPDGKPVTRTKPLTEFQGKSAAFGDRAMAADTIINGIGANYSPANVNLKNAVAGAPLIGGAMGGLANKYLLDENDQKIDQAKRDFINATLRQESGAAIGASEFANAEQQYFPQPGDSKAVVAQKAANRKLVITGFKRSAGANAEFTEPAAAAGGGAPAPTNKQGWVLHADASGNKAYVSPDGKQFQEVK